MNEAARLITRTSRYDHITKTLIYLHWLPIKERIQFKVFVTTFKALHNLAPTYISELLKQHVPSSFPFVLRQSVCYTNLLLIFKRLDTVRSGLQLHEYGISSPDRIRSMHSLTTFKRELKTHLFECAYAGHL